MSTSHGASPGSLIPLAPGPSVPRTFAPAPRLLPRSVRVAGSPVTILTDRAGTPTPLERTPRPFTRAELEVAWVQWSALDPRRADTVLVLAHTALRWDEARALTVDDLVPHAHQIIVRAHCPGRVRRPLAPALHRRVPVSLRIRQALRRLASTPGPRGLVFTDPDGAPLRRATVRRVLDWYHTAPGHGLADLPATAAQLWADDGTPRAVVAEWSGRPAWSSRPRG
ncbi:site-specific integrase [Propionibacterium freudenreichii]|uniref:site-specific integrase n=1 Tax=Propionibacterium freudenreichii TaxID=1744 RepID=UPI0005A5C902|nr:site-specific integrase [Propionibacterium freudenreichii]MCT2994026.1 site-specific integrase [Propionibacterium freudenreichii]MDK9651456.1 site-specific integrase [Propionibacterium freudenreichii]MDK9664864.1 site-specific integrase [Propionibacterium freudenreichii]CEI30848.1 phage integrase [Propionibacterium freudenreichii]